MMLPEAVVFRTVLLVIEEAEFNDDGDEMGIAVQVLPIRPTPLALSSPTAFVSDCSRAPDCGSFDGPSAVSLRARDHSRDDAKLAGSRFKLSLGVPPDASIVAKPPTAPFGALSPRYLFRSCSIKLDGIPVCVSHLVPDIIAGFNF